MKLLILTTGLIAGYVVGLFMEHRAMAKEVKQAQLAAEAWKQKDAGNYPLARQWRAAYEDLHKRCQ